MPAESSDGKVVNPNGLPRNHGMIIDGDEFLEACFFVWFLWLQMMQMTQKNSGNCEMEVRCVSLRSLRPLLYTG